jgi:hypothetical protein
LSVEFPQKQLIQDFIAKIDEFYTFLAKMIVDNPANADDYKTSIANLVSFIVTVKYEFLEGFREFSLN